MKPVIPQYSAFAPNLMINLTFSFQVVVKFFEPSVIQCLLEPWFREVGFIICYGAIILKLYRHLIEFRTRKAHRWVVKDTDLLKYLLIMIMSVSRYCSSPVAELVIREVGDCSRSAVPRKELPVEKEFNSYIFWQEFTHRIIYAKSILQYSRYSELSVQLCLFDTQYTPSI